MNMETKWVKYLHINTDNYPVIHKSQRQTLAQIQPHVILSLFTMNLRNSTQICISQIYKQIDVRSNLSLTHLIFQLLIQTYNRLSMNPLLPVRQKRQFTPCRVEGPQGQWVPRSPFPLVPILKMDDGIQEFEFAETFCKWIKILYDSPRSAGKMNGLISDYFSIYKGTCQGWCLLPFLFDVAREPLGIALRSEKRYRGITRGDTIHKVSLYADDLLLYITNLIQSISHLLRLLQEFGIFSGYNLSKSLLFSINSIGKSLKYNRFPFQTVYQAFKFLDVTITSPSSSYNTHKGKL